MALFSCDELIRRRKRQLAEPASQTVRVCDKTKDMQIRSAPPPPPPPQQRQSKRPSSEHHSEMTLTTPAAAVSPSSTSLISNSSPRLLSATPCHIASALAACNQMTRLGWTQRVEPSRAMWFITTTQTDRSRRRQRRRRINYNKMLITRYVSRYCGCGLMCARLISCMACVSSY